MADFMGVHANASELVNAMTVVAEPLTLSHHVAVADISGKRCPWIGQCSHIRLRMQQACRASGSIGGPRIQIEHLMTQAASGIICVVGEVGYGVICYVRVPRLY